MYSQQASPLFNIKEHIDAVLHEAILYISLGWYLTPLSVRGKRPLVKDWIKNATNDKDTVLGWANLYPQGFNVGLMTGQKSGVVIIDVDPRNGGDKHFQSVLDRYNLKSTGPRVMTGGDGGGFHLYFKHPNPTEYIRSCEIAMGVDLMADGGHHVVLPPSIHPSGKKYAWDVRFDNPDNALETFIPITAESASKTKTKRVKKSSVVPAPLNSNQSLGTSEDNGIGLDSSSIGVEPNFKAIFAGCEWIQKCKEHAAILPEPQWYAMLSIVARCSNAKTHAVVMSSGHPGFSEEETLKKLEQSKAASGPRTCKYIRESFTSHCVEICDRCQFGKRTEFNSSPIAMGLSMSDRGRFMLTDIGNAERFAKEKKGKWLFCPENDKWLQFIDGYWKTDVIGTIKKEVYSTVRGMLDSEDENTRKWAVQCESQERTNAMRKMAEPLMSISTTMFDRDHFKLMCSNGVLDLETKELTKGNPNDYITKCTHTEYDPTARSETVSKFIHEMCNWDNNLVDLLQRCIGYSLCGSVSEKKIFIIQGVSDSGKSTFANAIAHTLGDYSKTSDPDTFFDRKNRGAIRNDLAMLKDTRYVVTSEIKKEDRLSEDMVKRVTGGDSVACRFLHKEYFEFVPQFKIWMLCNDLPHIRTGDKALWNRVIIIPTHTVPAKMDRMLSEKLKQPENKRALLNWAVEGFTKYLDQGLTVPESVASYIKQYRTKCDKLAAWLDDCTVHDTNGRSKQADVKGSYDIWCTMNGEEKVSQKLFIELLEEKGYTRQAGRVDGEYCRYWAGLTIKDYV